VSIKAGTFILKSHYATDYPVILPSFSLWNIPQLYIVNPRTVLLSGNAFFEISDPSCLSSIFSESLIEHEYLYNFPLWKKQNPFS